MCEEKQIESYVETDSMWSSYLFELWRWDWIVPSKEVTDLVATGYALLDLSDQNVSNKVQNLSLVALEKYSPRLALGCQAHIHRNKKFFYKVLVNIFYNI